MSEASATHRPDESPRGAWVAEAAARFEGPLLIYAARLTGDADAARDVVQEAFLKLGGQSPAELNGRLAAWLFAVCRNGALDVRRKEKRVRAAAAVMRRELSEAEGARSESGAARRPRIVEASPADAAETRDTAAAALRIVARLPAKQAEALRLKFQAGLSYREIAEVMGETESNVGFLIHRGLKTVRERMKQR